MRTLLRSLPVLTAVPPPFDVSDLPDDPAVLFGQWLSQALDAGAPEPHAMVVSTCGTDRTPDGRVLTLKDLDARGWWFAAKGASTKGAQLAENPAATLTFYWPTVGRQVRVRGRVSQGTAEEAAADFHQRSFGSQAAALGSRQGQALGGREECLGAVAEARLRLAEDGTLVADSWSVYAVVADRVEFWQADAERQHVRVVYSGQDGAWERGLLWP